MINDLRIVSLFQIPESIIFWPHVKVLNNTNIYIHSSLTFTSNRRNRWVGVGRKNNIGWYFSKICRRIRACELPSSRSEQLTKVEQINTDIRPNMREIVIFLPRMGWSQTAKKVLCVRNRFTWARRFKEFHGISLVVYLLETDPANHFFYQI